MDFAKIFKKIREIIASPIVFLSLSLSMLAGFIYGDGFIEFVMRIGADLHGGGEKGVEEHAEHLKKHIDEFKK